MMLQSYGGFVTLHVLGEEDDDTFRCGIAVSPITDWKYYGIRRDMPNYLFLASYEMCGSNASCCARFLCAC